MRTSYDATSDAFYARFAPDDVEVAETQEIAPGVMIDLDAKGEFIGLEVLSVSRRQLGEYGVTRASAAA